MDFLNSLTKDLSIDKVRNLAEDAINQAKPKTDVEKRVYEVLSHKNWGASSTLLNEIARDSYDFEKSNTISRLMWEGMASRPAGWRVVFKSLTLVEHLLKNGSERCVEDARNHQHQLSGMLSFNYYEDTVDRGAGVREKAKQMIELLADNERLREERVRAKALREKFGGAGASMPSSDIHGFASGGYGNGGIGSSSDGYGNSGLGSSGGGYGNGGIGSSGGVLSNSGFGSSGGGYGNSGIGSDTQFSGRYANDAVKNSYKDDVAPPSPKKDAEKDKTKTKKKKKKKETDLFVSDKALGSAPSLAPPPADLLAFETPAEPTPAPPCTDFFSQPSSKPASTDLFAESTSASPATDMFDAFGSSVPPSNPTAAALMFDAFDNGPVMPSSSPPVPPSPATAAVEDDFGDFGSAEPALELKKVTNGLSGGPMQNARMPPTCGMGEMGGMGHMAGMRQMVGIEQMSGGMGQIGMGQMSGMSQMVGIPQMGGMSEMNPNMTAQMMQQVQKMNPNVMTPMMMGDCGGRNASMMKQASSKNVMGGAIHSQVAPNKASDEFGDFSSGLPKNDSNINEDGFIAGQLSSLAASEFKFKDKPLAIGGGEVHQKPDPPAPAQTKSSGFNSFAGIDGLPVKIVSGNNAMKSKLTDKPVMSSPSLKQSSSKCINPGAAGITLSGQSSMGGMMGMMSNQGGMMPNDVVSASGGMMPQAMSMQQMQQMQQMMMANIIMQQQQGAGNGAVNMMGMGAMPGMLQGMGQMNNQSTARGNSMGDISMNGNQFGRMSMGDPKK